MRFSCRLLIGLPVSARVRYVACHAGAPLHELACGGERQSDIKAIIAATRPPLHPYVGYAAAHVSSMRYPAGWAFAASRFAARCEHVDVFLADHADAVASRYAGAAELQVPSNGKVHFERTDGYAFALRHATADIVFLYPPFTPNADSDWKALAEVCEQLSRQKGAFVAWYPIYWPPSLSNLSTRPGASPGRQHGLNVGPSPAGTSKAAVYSCLTGCSRSSRPPPHTPNKVASPCAARRGSRGALL